MTTSTALLTDHYELTMVSAALKDGTADRAGVFEVFARRLPAGRRYGVVAGVARLVEAIASFRFGPTEIAFLRERGVVDDETLTWLAERLQTFVDLNPEFEVPVERLATWLARADDEDD